MSLYTSSHNQQRHNVTGAPFKIGNIVRIDSATDTTADKKYIGRIGKIVYFDYTCGCGQLYPTDPMIGILFSNGKTKEFWSEEITKI